MEINQINSEIKESLKDWKAIISQYEIPSNRKAIYQILNTFLPFVGLWVLIYFALKLSFWLALPLFLINTFFLVRIFIIQHDCGHHSFFKSKKLNNLVGSVCSVFSFIPYKYWSKVHNYHHGHSGQLEVREIGDIPTITVSEYMMRNWWGKLQYRVWRMPVVTFGIAPIFYFIISCRFPTFTFNNWRRYTKMIVKDNIVIALVYIACGFFIGWKMFFIIQLTLVFMFGVVAFWFFYVQHQHEHSYKHWKDNWDYVLASIRGSSYYKLPKFWHWLTGNIGYHHIHHLSSVIPNYNLPKAFKEKPILSKYVTKISFLQSLKLMKMKLWDEQQEKMITFSEYRSLYKYKMAI